MYNVGMCGGVFEPLHRGHKNLIIQAASDCKELYVVLSVSKCNTIDYHLRYRWLTQMTATMENVKVIISFDNSESKDGYDWDKGCEDIRHKIGKHIDVVYVGSDYNYAGNPFETHYTDSKIVYIDRDKTEGITSTAIRHNPYKYWNAIADEAKEYYVKKVVVLGTESCGKSTLVRNLGNYYNTVYVEEKGRDICEFAGGIDNMIEEDFVEILYKHKVDEIDKTRRANKVLFIDTECYITEYYLKLQCRGEKADRTAKLAECIGSLNKYDLVIYLEPDVEWVQDGTRTYGEEKVRLENDRILKEILSHAGLNYKIVNGSYRDRFTQSVELVNRLFENKKENITYEG